MLLELLFAATIAGQDVYTQEECFRWNEERGETEPVNEAGCLVSWIYSAETHAALDPFGRDMEAVFSREAIAAIEAARSRTPEGELTPGLDADPFCACQDPEGLFLIVNITQETSPTQVTSGVGFTFKPAGMSDEDFARIIVYDQGTTPIQVTQRVLVLVREANGWRVDDVLDGEGWSFRASLEP